MMSNNNTFSEIESLERRIEISAKLSDFVYDYERTYMNNKNSKPSASHEYLNNIAISGTSEEILKKHSTLTLVDADYSSDLGVAVIAVQDNVTEETYIVFAGTNKEADGDRDFISDATIGLMEFIHKN